MVGNTENKVLIREYNEDTDMEVVGRLEKNCEIGSNKEVSIFTNMKGDPLCRIRFYPIHVMLVGEGFFLFYFLLFKCYLKLLAL